MFKLLHYQLALVYASRAHVVYVLAFFVMLVSLFPLALSPSPETLQSVGVGVVWMALVLVVTLATDSAFDEELASGRLAQMRFVPASYMQVVFTKWLSAVLGYIVPLAVMVPIALALYHYPLDYARWLVPTVLLGGMVLTLLGLFANSVMLGVRHGRLMSAVILLPLYVPIIILGAGTQGVIARGENPYEWCFVFVGLLFILLPVSLYVTAASLKAAVQEE